MAAPLRRLFRHFRKLLPAKLRAVFQLEMATRDGFSWTETDSLRPGIPCIGAIQPPSNYDSQADTKFDVVVVGAGYSGLTAVRETTLSGLKVLLLEARDRIGGRSWSSNIDGYPYEMGGTWVFWGQSNVWREIARYGMQDELEQSYDFTRGINKFLLASTNGTQEFTHDEEEKLVDSALSKVCNVDGTCGRDAVPYPHSPKLNDDAQKYDKMSVAERLAQIEGDLSENERLVAEAFVLLCSGATLETTSFYEFLHWWALCGYTYEGAINHLIRYKFKGGQSSFATKFFGEALTTGNLTYSFNQPIASVKDTGAGVEVTTRNGETYSATKMISCIPLNVLKDIKFEPPISEGKAKAAETGHVNQTIKIHAEVSDRDLRSFTGISYPHNGMIFGLGDGETPVGNTHIVAFGAQHNHFHPEDDIEKTKEAMRGFAPMDIKRIVFHNWSRDEFAKGAWFFSGPGLLSSHLTDMRDRHGNIFFACSDWASGWRSFIDGAIEEGARAAVAVRADLTGKDKIWA